MRSLAFAVAVPLLLASATASAHFNLTMPPSSKGDTGGGKGSPPCGPDTAEGTITPVTGGTDLTIAIKETVRHGGFYRFALALTSCHTKGCFPVDNTVYDKNNMVLMAGGVGTSDHADSTANPVFPLLGDNMFPHPQDGDPPLPAWNGTVPVPNVTCDKCTLQVIEFMEPHGTNGDAGFFYHHCADLKITADPNKPIFNPGGAGGGGAGGASGGGASGAGGSPVVGGAGGISTGGTAAGGASGSGTSAGTGTSGGALGTAGSATAGSTTTPIAGTTGSGGSGVVAPATSSDDGGCGIAKSSRGGASALAALGLVLALVRRRRAS